MAPAAEHLRPRLPVRAPAAAARACALVLATEAMDLDQLVVVAQRLAREHTPCLSARFLWRADSELDGAPAVPGEEASNAIDIVLADGRARLSLYFAEQAVAFFDERTADFGWIDLLDLRLCELLIASDLRREAAAAHRSEHLQEALYAIADLAYSNLDVGEMLARVHQIVGRLTYAKNFFIGLYDDVRDAMHFPYYADEGDSTMSPDGAEVAGRDFPSSLTFAVVHGGRSLLGPSKDLRAALGLGDDVRLGRECVDWLGVPMLEGERVRGAVVVQSYDEHVRYTEEDRSLLAFVAQHILTAVSRKQAQEQLEAEVLRRTAELAQANDALRQEVTEREHAQRMQAVLFRIAELASERGAIDEFYAGVHEVVSSLLNARNFFISLLSEDGTELHFPYLADERDEALQPRRLTNGITEWVLRQRRPLLVTASEIRTMIEAGEMIVFGTLPECWLGVPLMLDGRAFGVMAIQSYDNDKDYGLEEQEILQFASLQISTAFERRQTQERLRKANIDLEKRVESRTRELKLANADLRNQIVVREQIESQLQHEALHDALTGLPNRTALLARMERALARYQADNTCLFAVLFLDLDRFKVVNDSVGHLLGDELLIEAGRRIAACAHDPNSVARLGGDEFTLLIEDIRGIDDAKEVAARVIAAMVDPIRVGDKEIYSSASIGIALAHPRYTRPEELLRDADVAMYRAKAHGRQRLEVFDEKLHQEALAILDIESDLRRGLLRHQFEPYLQPIVRLADGAVLGYEALLRWRHSSRGLLLPSEFLAVAEDSGNVEQIDWQIYEQVLRAIPDLGETDTYVGINVSARHFRSANLAQALLEMIDAYKVPRWRIRVEVTEGALLQNPEQACTTMLHLRDAGVLTSLDDFGTGYSSLSYLHRFPLHALKIDRSFVAELKPDLTGSSVAVVRAIRALAGSLNMEVIAEGIETQAQCDALRQLECTTGQGFLFAHPQPARDFVRLRG